MNLSQLYKRTVKELTKSGIKSAEIDAQILLEFVSGKSREFLLAHPEFEPSEKEYKRILKLNDRRKLVYPIAYIIGHKEFFGLDFLVTPDVLIPRPETELLVEQALFYLRTKKLKNKRTIRILDVGTGSGNIIISIAKICKKFPIGNKLHIFASDISKKALIIAKRNAEKHQVDIKFIQSDLFENINGKFDLIVANLPYVPKDSSDDKEIKYEPQNAIFAKDNGTAIIKKFFNQAKNHINSNGLILVEVDPRNAKELQNYASKLYKTVKIKKDFSGIYRMLKVLT